MEMPLLKQCPSNIGIIGTGDFGRALAKRLVSNGVDVTIGSRFPEKRQKLPRDDILTKVKVTSILECVQSSDVVVIAIHVHDHASLAPLASHVSGKVLVDVSNTFKKSSSSNAEKLQEMFPRAFVVKALNNVSSYHLESLHIGQRSINVAGDSNEARAIVSQLVSRLGYLAVESGTLLSARRLEEANRELFAGWGWGSLAMAIVFVIWTVYGAIQKYVITDPPIAWERMFFDVFSKVFACVSLNLLALAYIPGPIAALKQLASGTKHRRFPKSLERFLMMRKALGLYALMFGSLHTLMTIAILNPAYFGSWFATGSAIVPANTTTDTEIDIASKMSWKGEISGLFGMLGIGGMVILGITSINSITNVFNWREWQVIHSHFGFVVLVLSTAHVGVHAGPGWKSGEFKDFAHKLSFNSLWLPMFAILLKLIILLPCVYIPLQKIRRGHERGAKSSPVVAPIDAEMGKIEQDNGRVGSAGSGKVNHGLDNSEL